MPSLRRFVAIAQAALQCTLILTSLLEDLALFVFFCAGHFLGPLAAYFSQASWLRPVDAVAWGAPGAPKATIDGGVCGENCLPSGQPRFWNVLGQGKGKLLDFGGCSLVHACPPVNHEHAGFAKTKQKPAFYRSPCLHEQHENSTER